MNPTPAERLRAEAILLWGDACRLFPNASDVGVVEVEGVTLSDPRTWGDGWEYLISGDLLRTWADALDRHETAPTPPPPPEPDAWPPAPPRATKDYYIWQIATTRAVAEGAATPKEASRKGWFPGFSSTADVWKPLPDRLYHVTTAKNAVLRDRRLKSRKDLGIWDGPGLGGGPQDTISLAADLETAKNIERAIHEARAVLHGRLTPEMMWQQARLGTGAKRSWANELQELTDYDPRLEKAVGIASWSFWFNWTIERWRAGGPRPVAFVNTDAKRLASIPADQIAVLEFEPVHPGVHGIYEGDEGEIRMPFPDLLRLRR